MKGSPPPPPSIRIGVNALVLKNPLTGVAKRMLSLYAPLPRILPGAEVYFFTPHPLSEATLDCLRDYGIDPWGSGFRIVTTPVWGQRLPVIREIAEWWWLYFLLPALLRQYHVRVYEAPWGRGIPLFFKNTPALILTVHDLIPLYPLSLKNFSLLGKEVYRRFQSLYYRWRMAGDLRRVDRVITVSPQVAEDLIRFFPSTDPSKVVVIPNGVNERIFSSGKTEAVEEYIRTHGIPNTAARSLPKKILFYIGGFNPRKNLPCLLKAMEKIGDAFSDYALVLAGKENTYFHRVVLPLIRSHPFPIFRLGYLPETHLPSFYQGAELVCYPSLSEGFGLPALEALAAGGRVLIDQHLPINQGGEGGFIAEWMQKAFPRRDVAGWWKEQVIAVDGRKAEAIAAALNQALKNPPSSPKGNGEFWGKPCPFRWENLATDYARLLSDLLRGMGANKGRGLPPQHTGKRR